MQNQVDCYDCPLARRHIERETRSVAQMLSPGHREVIQDSAVSIKDGKSIRRSSPELIQTSMFGESATDERYSQTGDRTCYLKSLLQCAGVSIKNPHMGIAFACHI
jgi:hypothetical protein